MVRYIFNFIVIIISLINSYCYYYIEDFDKTVFNENFFNKKITIINEYKTTNDEIRENGGKYVYLEENFFFFEVEKLGNNYISKKYCFI